MKTATIKETNEVVFIKKELDNFIVFYLNEPESITPTISNDIGIISNDKIVKQCS